MNYVAKFKFSNRTVARYLTRYNLIFFIMFGISAFLNYLGYLTPASPEYGLLLTGLLMLTSCNLVLRTYHPPASLLHVAGLFCRLVRFHRHPLLY